MLILVGIPRLLMCVDKKARLSAVSHVTQGRRMLRNKHAESSWNETTISVYGVRLHVKKPKKENMFRFLIFMCVLHAHTCIHMHFKKKKGI